MFLRSPPIVGAVARACFLLSAPAGVAVAAGVAVVEAAGLSADDAAACADLSHAALLLLLTLLLLVCLSRLLPLDDAFTAVKVSFCPQHVHTHAITSSLPERGAGDKPCSPQRGKLDPNWATSTGERTLSRRWPLYPLRFRSRG